MRSSKIFLFFLFLFTLSSLQAKADIIFNDVSRLNPTAVFKIVPVHTIKDIRDSLQEAKSKRLKISIAGKRHSQGGQQSCINCIVLDMLEFNKIISFDAKNKIIKVEPGVTWERIQDYVQPYGCAVKVMQASNVFTVGGSLGSNIHGNDPNYGTIIETVKSFRLMQADGTIINVSREENPELFELVIGGYGLFGVITDVDLELTDDVIYEMRSEVMDYKAYPSYFRTHILGDRNVGLYSAKLSNAPSSLLKEVVTTAYIKSEKKKDGLFKLQQESDVERNKFFFGLSRRYDWGKDLRWFLQKYLIENVGRMEYISRNNAMRPIIKFLDYYSPHDTDILQEYFVPMDTFVEFVDQLRGIIQKEHINLLSITIRHVPRDSQSFLSYAKSDVFSVVLYINQGLDKDQIRKAQTWTREMVDLALNEGGTYYLPYQRYPTQEQLLKSYPQFDIFIKKKQKYDPNELFMNQLYESYHGN